MPKSLAKALIDAGMKHFDGGGFLNQAFNDASNFQMQSLTGGPIFGAHGAAGMGPMGIWSGLTGGGMSPNNPYTQAVPDVSKQAGLPGQIDLQQTWQQNVMNQQQNLANALLAQSQGYGPNPAQAQLAQNTARNTANQASLMASQRGANANAGLIARQAAMQGGALQQQGVGQAATLQAQQQLGAQQALQQQQSQMAQQALQGQSIAQGALAAQNTANINAQLGAGNINANIAGQNAATRGGILGGALGGIGAAIGGGLFAHGGEVKKMATGGDVMDIQHYSTPGYGEVPLHDYSQKSGQGMFGGMGNLVGGIGNSGLIGDLFGAGAGAGAGYSGALMAGGAADAVTEAAPLVLLANKGAQIPFSTALLQGGTVPGKASVQGDSEKNDTQPTLLSPGEVVLPRSVTMAPNAEEKAAEFVAHLKSRKKKGYAKVADAKRGKNE